MTKSPSCNPMPGSSVRRILQARSLEWAAFPSAGDLPDLGSTLGLLHCRVILYHLSHQGSLLRILKDTENKTLHYCTDSHPGSAVPAKNPEIILDCSLCPTLNINLLETLRALVQNKSRTTPPSQLHQAWTLDHLLQSRNLKRPPHSAGQRQPGRPSRS